MEGRDRRSAAAPTVFDVRSRVVSAVSMLPFTSAGRAGRGRGSLRERSGAAAFDGRSSSANRGTVPQPRKAIAPTSTPYATPLGAASIWAPTTVWMAAASPGCARASPSAWRSPRGFSGVFIVAGLPVSAGLRLVLHAVPWLAVAIGAALIALGLLTLAGRRVSLLAAGRLQPDAAQSRGLRRVALFGVAYALAWLSCTLAVFLVVVSQSLTVGGVGQTLAVFAAYAAGSASILLALCVSAALTKGALTRLLRRTALSQPSCQCPADRLRRLPARVLAARGDQRPRRLDQCVGPLEHPGLLGARSVLLLAYDAVRRRARPAGRGWARRCRPPAISHDPDPRI